MDISDKKSNKDDITNISINKGDRTNIAINKGELKDLIKDIKNISSFVNNVKKNNRPVLRYITDKEFVIIGVVIIAIMSMFVITDPTLLLTSIVSGLFGIGTGRSMRADVKSEYV